MFYIKVIYVSNLIDIKLWYAKKLANDIRQGKIDPKDIELKKLSAAKRCLSEAGEKQLADTVGYAYARSFSSKIERETANFKKIEDDIVEIVRKTVKNWAAHSHEIALPFILKRFYRAKDHVDSVAYAISDIIFGSCSIPKHMFEELIRAIDSILPHVKDELAVRKVEATNIMLADIPNKRMNAGIDMAERLLGKIDHASNLIIEYEKKRQNE